MNVLAHDDLVFRYRDCGEGLPFVFQHGLGADGAQPFDLAVGLPAVRLLTLDCRAHGETRPIGPPEKIGLAQSADDLLALLNDLRIERAVIGGISMGAAIAVSFVLRYPKRVLALVLSRPAWLNAPEPSNLRFYAVVARLIRAHGPERGLHEFVRSDGYRELADQCPASAASLTAQFQEPRAAEAVIRLERIPRDVPSTDRRDWGAIGVPTLVLATRDDLIHPFAYGTEIAGSIPGAELREISPKAVSVPSHIADTRAAIGDFLASSGIG